MTNFQKRKKFDLRKFINRTKNRFQRVRKFCRMHTLPVLVAVGIMVSVIFASYQNAYATGLEEYFYYTYFDLMSGLFAETGMDFGLKAFNLGSSMDATLSLVESDSTSV